MPQLRAWFSRLLGLLRRNCDAEITEEIRQHVDLLIERNIAAGMSPNEARTAALREFGGVEQIKEIAREERIWCGRRNLSRSPLRRSNALPQSGFSILAILCLTLGIGTSAAVMSWIEGILIRPYPWSHTRTEWSRCLVPGKELRKRRPFLSRLSRSPKKFNSVRVIHCRSDHGHDAQHGDRAERASGGIVSANYFDALGVRPMLGRGFGRKKGRTQCTSGHGN